MFQDLLSAGGRARRVKVSFQSKSKGLRLKREYGISSSLKADRLVTLKEPVFLSKSKGRTSPMPQLK